MKPQRILLSLVLVFALGGAVNAEPIQTQARLTIGTGTGTRLEVSAEGSVLETVGLKQSQQRVRVSPLVGPPPPKPPPFDEDFFDNIGKTNSKPKK